jgi:glycogen debranching enzyme
VLLTGLASPERAKIMARTLMAPDMFSGWGIRTLSTKARRYNPMSYHNGSVWPHDNGMIALGFARYGLMQPVLRIFEGLAGAARFLPLRRLPELFCGFPRIRNTGPTGYPVACLPQAWAAATPLALTAACLGLGFTNAARDVALKEPRLPDFLTSLAVHGLTTAAGRCDVVMDQAGGRIVRLS